MLHVLQDGEFSRLGARRPTKVNVRVLAATNRKLEQAVLKGEFRNDLYFRLNVITLNIPPLRERRSDILLLCKCFLEKYREKYASSVQTLPKDLLEACVWYDWPGNVRQLENIVKRQLILPDGDIISELRSKAKQAVVQSPATLQEIGDRAAEEAEKKVVVVMLDQTGWNQKEAARRLHISYKAFRNRLKKWQLSRECPNREQEHRSQLTETFSNSSVSSEYRLDRLSPETCLSDATRLIIQTRSHIRDSSAATKYLFALTTRASMGIKTARPESSQMSARTNDNFKGVTKYR